MTEPNPPAVASEPAEPTTRQDELIEKAFTVADGHQPDGRNHYGYDQCDCGWVAEGGTERWADHLVHLLAVEGLLADPAQTTELERLRTNLEFSQETTQIGLRKVAELTAEVHRLRRELAEARARKQADLDELKRTLGLTRNTLKQNVEWRDRFRAERDEDRAELGETRRERDLLLWLHAEAAWRVAGFDVLTVALARRNHQLTAERDERQARIDSALAKLNASDQATSWEAMYDLVVEAKTILRGWASAEPAGEATPVEELRRAALVGDQPPAEERPFGIRLAEASMRESQRLSGLALRAVEEADDAAEPACECFVVPEEQWTRHYDATEPGSMVEQNPDCPVHPAQQTDAAGDLP